ncbi:MAG: shikimate kinase [Thalassomonas sp.]|jgi:shikimate kinase
MVYLIGYMGAGKTTIAKLLSKQLYLPFYDTDKEIEKKEKRSVSEVFKKDGELHFRILETELLIQLNTKAVIACGGGIPIHNNNMDLINTKGISFYLKASANCLANRLKEKTQSRPLITKIPENELEPYIKKELQKRSSFYNLAHYTILVDGKNKEDILREIHTLISTL